MHSIGDGNKIIALAANLAPEVERIKYDADTWRLTIYFDQTV